MGKASKKRGRALAKAQRALRKVIASTELYYNDTSLLNVCNAAKSTPSGKRYLELEKVFLTICDSMGKTPAELDLEIWNSFAKV
jgi:hypothetical protein